MGSNRRNWLLLAPWSRGPLLLVRRPGVALALAVAAAVAVMPMAAGPLFLSSAGSATLAARSASACPTTLGSQVVTGGAPVDDFSRSAFAEAENDEAAAAGHITNLGAAVTSLISTDVVVGSRARHATVDIVGRDNAAPHVRLVAGGPGPGLWLPEPLATSLGLRPGDTLDVYPDPSLVAVPIGGGRVDAGGRGGAAKPIAVPVVAIYQDLRDRTDDPFWCGISLLYRGTPAQQSGLSDTPIRDLLLVDTATMLSLGERGHLIASLRIERAPTMPDLTVPQAVALAGAVTTMQQALALQLTAVHNLNGGSPPRLTSIMPGIATRADLVQQRLASAVLPISAAGLAVGLAVVAAAGVFWARRRRAELTVLATFGATPGWLGVKAILESWPALAVGGLGGWALATFLVTETGPGHLIASDARNESLVALALVFCTATVVAGGAAAVTLRSIMGAERPRRQRRRLSAVPWEVALLMAAALVWLLASNQYMVQLATFSGTLVVIPPKLILVPMLGMVGIGLLAVRLGIRAANRRRGGRSPRTPGRLLYARRLRHAAMAVAILALITAVPIALAVYGGTATRSVSATLDAQARLALGSDVVVTLGKPAPVPAALRGQATPVINVPGVQVGDVTATMLAVDPATFAQDAFLDDRLDDGGLAQVLRPLRAAPAGGVVAAVASAPIGSGTVTVDPALGSKVKLAITGVPALPAGEGEFPVVIVDRAALDAVTTGPDSLTSLGASQLWIRGDPVAIRAAINAAGLQISGFQVAADRYVDTFYQPVTFAFGYLGALSIFTQVVTMVGFLLYLESRLPVLRRGFVMLRSLGMRGGRQGLLLLAELLTPFAVGTVIGLGLAATSIALFKARLNIDPQEQPGTVLSVPYLTIAAILGGVVLFTCAVAIVTHRRLARSRAGEVLREVA